MALVAAKDVGIVAMEAYFPQTFVDQSELEQFDGVGVGKYTIGLGQKSMAFCDDREDIVSICMTAVSNLLQKYNIPHSAIGRLEVGTETLLDKSKSVKSDLMRLFQDSGNTDIEGTDTINACYGGTNALFNSIAWVESSSWDGRYAICVTGDIAVYEKGNARPSGGCGVVAMLIGPNAPLVLEHGLRASHMENAYDFYKPNLASEYPVVDGAYSTTCYIKAIDLCYSRLIQKASAWGLNLNIGCTDYSLFHSPFNKMIQKSYGRMLYNDFLLHPHAPHFEHHDHTKLQAFLTLSREDSYNNRDLEKFFTDISKVEYKRKVQPGTFLQQELGNSYTASLYTGLMSLIDNVGEKLEGKRVSAFSYGSGLCSTMFLLRAIHRKPTAALFGTVGQIQKVADISARIAARVKKSPQEFTEALELRKTTYGAHSFVPKGKINDLSKGTYFLERVDDKWRRFYAKKD